MFMYIKGLSVWYDRDLQLSTEEANRVIDNYENEGSVCPSTLRDKLFTTGNLDNIDRNPSSTSSLDYFHGTVISITQHVTNDNPGVLGSFRRFPKTETSQSRNLSSHYQSHVLMCHQYRSLALSFQQ